MSADLRRHPRFVDARVVQVQIASREELRELWSVDISKGGMFVETEEPPARGTRIDIRLDTPGGPLSLKAEVVHVVDAQTARAYSQRAGVGVQFIDLTRQIREKIEQYVEGLASKLSTDLALAGSEALDVLLKEAKRISDALTASDLYGALQLPPSAASEELAARIERLCQRLTNPPSDSSPPKVERLRQTARQLERAAPLFKDQRRRLHFDFQHGFVRAESRRKAGEDFELLRVVWSEVFPDRIAAGLERHRDACALAKAGRFTECVAVISTAVELDPFQVDYRAEREAWTAELAPRLDLIDDLGVVGLEPSALTEGSADAFGATASHVDAAPREIVKLAAQVQSRTQSSPGRLSNRDARGTNYQLELSENGTPVEAARMKNEIGLAHLRRADFENARRFLTRAVELDPLPEYKMNSASAMITDASFDRAQADARARPLLSEAIRDSKVDDDDGRRRIGRCHYLLGRLMRDQGQLPQAEKQFAKAVSFDPRLAEASSELRLIRKRTKKKRPGLIDIFKRD